MEGLNMYNFNNPSNYIYNNIDIDVDRLVSLGFRPEEVQTLQYIIYNGGKVTNQSLVKYGIPYKEAKRLKYMHDICVGKVSIENKNDLCKHLRKLFCDVRRIGIQDLAVSKVSKVPRKAVIAGIKDETFKIYNSKNYDIKDRMYDVVDVTGKRIVIETDRKPVLKYKQPKFVEGVIEIKELKDDGNVVVSVDKEYIKLVNRFIIVGSLRRPEFHNGMIEIICTEGTKVYVFAQTLGTKEKVSYNMGTQRVYEYGFNKDEIDSKLTSVGIMIYKKLCGVYASKIPANQDFRLLNLEEDDKEDIEIEE